MKRFSLAIALLLFTAIVFAQPQGKGDPQQRIERMNEHMKTELELTDQQYTAVSAMNEEMVYAMMELKGSEDKGAVKDLRDQYRDQLETVLTEDQMVKAKALFEERKKHRHRKHEEN